MIDAVIHQATAMERICDEINKIDKDFVFFFDDIDALVPEDKAHSDNRDKLGQLIDTILGRCPKAKILITARKPLKSAKNFYELEVELTGF